MNSGNLAMVYGIVALLSALLTAFYLLWDKNRNRLFLALFGCVTASNCGYFLLSICNSLSAAKFANGLSYFGGAFSMLVMLLIIYDVSKLKRRRWMLHGAVTLSSAAFALAASGDWLGLYYRSMSIETVNGMTHLVKEYGPLHGLYAIYLAAYVVIMLVIIGYAARTDRLHSPKYTAFLFVAVLLNVGVWLVEQAMVEEFEFLSVSYIVTAALLLLIYNMLCEYGIILPDAGVLSAQMLQQLNMREAIPTTAHPGVDGMLNGFVEKVKTLTPAERRILNYYMDGHESTDIPELAFISIHTVKKHNRSIYQKLQVSSRDELMLYIELFRCCDRMDELTHADSETIEEI